ARRDGEQLGADYLERGEQFRLLEHRKRTGSGQKLHLTGYSLFDGEPGRNHPLATGRNDSRIQGKVQDEAQRAGNEELSLAPEKGVEPVESSTQRFTCDRVMVFLGSELNLGPAITR
ncbi:MAG: hypothetical protein VYC52_03810, partial [Pseudomonadota bacterium]|nr:hypothetical protein [Pseudomonadota bacterium]